MVPGGPPGPFGMALGTGRGVSLAPTRLQDSATRNELSLFLAVSQMRPSKESKYNHSFIIEW